MLRSEMQNREVMMSQEQIYNLEAHLAHLSKTCEELSDIVAAQHKQIDKLTRFIEKFTDREVENVTQGFDRNPDKNPPHW